MDETLFPFQREGAAWLAGRRLALLADEMGLGKSAQAIVAADTIKAERILVLCPASVRINWTREFATYSTRGMPCVAILQTANQPPLPKSGIVTCSYSLALSNNVGSSLRNWLATTTKNSLLILDEVHYLKGVDAKRSHAVLGKGGLIHAAYRTWALSGTPAPNHAGELYPILRCFGVARDSYEGWIGQYCVVRHTPFGSQIVGSKNIPELRALIAPVILRRKKEDVMKELPALVFEDLTVEAGPVDEELFFPDYWIAKNLEQLPIDVAKAKHVLEVNMEAMGQATAANVAALQGLERAKNMTTLRRYVGLQKVAAVVDIVGRELEFGAYQKIVLFAIHRDVIECLRVGLKDYKPITLYGGTPADKRQANIDRFMKDPRCRVFIGNIQAAGTGVEGLQRAAHHAMLVECDWTPGNNAQAVMRLHRIGQAMPVNIRVVGLANDVDERVQKVLRRKMKDLVALFD